MFHSFQKDRRKLHSFLIPVVCLAFCFSARLYFCLCAPRPFCIWNIVTPIWLYILSGWQLLSISLPLLLCFYVSVSLCLFTHLLLVNILRIRISSSHHPQPNERQPIAFRKSIAAKRIFIYASVRIYHHNNM